GVFTAQGELRQTQGIGAEGAGLAAGNQLVGGGHRVGDVAGDFQQQVLGQGLNLRPVLDVGAKAENLVEVALAVTGINAAAVTGIVELIGRDVGGVVDVGSRGQD